MPDGLESLSLRSPLLEVQDQLQVLLRGFVVASAPFHDVDCPTLEELRRIEFAFKHQNAAQPIDGAGVGGVNAERVEEVTLSLTEQRILARVLPESHSSARTYSRSYIGSRPGSVPWDRRALALSRSPVHF